MLINQKIPIYYILNKIKYQLVYVSIIAIIVYYLTLKFHNVLPTMPLTIPTFIGTAISILLSFKISQSYDRWWEARKVWGSIVNDSRSFILQLQALLPQNAEPVIKKIAYRQMAWCYVLGQSLRGKAALDGMEDFLPQEEISNVEAHQNKSLALLQLHSRDIAAAKDTYSLDANYHVQLDNTLVRLCDSMGKAERIKSTVFPVTYRLFLHFIIYLFVVTLSIALNGVDAYFEIPLLLLISSAFFLLEKSATHLQDPFSNKPTDTAMTAIARTIEINIRQLLNEKDIPEPLQPQKFYLM